MKYLGKIIDNKDLVTKEYVDDKDSYKVDKIEGKGLSTNDYTTIDKNKLNDIDTSKYVRIKEGLTVVSSVPINADTLNGYTDTDFYKKTDVISADTLGGYAESSFIKKTDTINVDTFGGYTTDAFLKINNTIDANTLNGKTDTDFILKTDEINAAKISGYTASQFYKKGVNPVLDNDSVVDNLNSTDKTKVLSANQGKILNDGKLNLSGGTMTGAITTSANKLSFKFASPSSGYGAGIGYDSTSHECVAFMTNKENSRFRFHSGIDLDNFATGSMMLITPDFEIKKSGIYSAGEVGIGSKVNMSYNSTTECLEFKFV